ncbi:MAG TPA: tRNA dihydrouridine(20/20a) synthase DusA [Legionella sp.]|nr:tRNA dihydrouridine(20/20a) synthase DusA [Legionella sp.]
MIDWTYTHFRVFMRMLAPHALLYTDMQTVGAVMNNPTRALAFHPMERPLALQLGGADKEGLVACAVQAERLGFSEVNLNLGCPSDRVQAGRFGACLMADPQRVAECIQAMKGAVSIPVTAKTRIGIDTHDSYAFFASFAHRLMDAGCDKLIVHARKAWLHGLNPKQNRTIPPVIYDYVYQIKLDFPSRPVVINGNINTLPEINGHLKHVDGVMLGRLVCQNPYALAVIHHALYPQTTLLTRSVVLQKYVAYIESVHPTGVPMSILLKPVLNLPHGLKGGRDWKARLLTVVRLNSPAGLQDAVVELAHMETHPAPIDTVSFVD